jgi:SAM-dependent methyltransferase
MDAVGDAWSAVATVWAELWGDVADPVRHAIQEVAGIRSGSRVLDVGCGSGEFLGMLADAGAIPTGIDPARGMVDLARARVRGADLRVGLAESLPWPDASFDVVTAINALQFADDPDAALAEIARVTVPGGFIAVANWAEAARNDLNVIESAVARSFDEELPPDDDYRMPGGLAAMFRAGGVEPIATGIVEVSWSAANDDQLVRGILMGEDEAGLAAGAATVITAAQRFRTPAGGYRLANAFRYAVGRTPVRSA